MKRFAVVAGVLAIISGIILKGTFGHWIIVIASGLYLGAPLALFLVLWLIVGLKRTGQIPSRLRTTFIVTIIAGASLFVSLGVGTAIHYFEIHQARSYVARIVPMLDEYRQKHGQFPTTLVDVNAPSPPEILADTHGYSGRADYFRFEYWDAAGMMDGYYFDSVTRKWTYFD